MPYTDNSKRLKVVYEGITVIDSTTTSVGDAGGLSIIDSTLIGAGANSYIGMAVIINPGDFANVDIKPAATFNNVTGEVGVSAAFKGGQVAADTRYMIVMTGFGSGAAPPPVSPSIGLWMFGVCNPGMTASTTTLICNNLAGFPDDIFNDEFWVQVIHNDDSPGNAPEREWRRITDYATSGTFTVDAFSVVVEENDLLAIVHESIAGIEILGFGTFTTSSATVPADTNRTEGDDYFNGCSLMPTEGACRFQPRVIVDYTGATGIFTLDPGNPLTAVPGLVDYIIIGNGGAGLGMAGISATTGTYPHPSGVAEQIAFTITIPRPMAVMTIYLDFVNLTQNADVRIYHQIDGATHRVIQTFNWTTGMDDGLFFREVAANDDVQVTIQSTLAEGVARDIPYEYLTRG